MLFRWAAPELLNGFGYARHDLGGGRHIRRNAAAHIRFMLSKI